MGKSAGAAPTPPDPVATAKAQTETNNQTAAYNAKLNRIDTTTPYGSQTYNYVPPAKTIGADGTSTSDPSDPGKWSQTIALSPEQQKLYNTETGVSQSAYDLAASQFPRVQNTLDSNFNFTGPSMVSGLNVADPAKSGSIATGYDSGGAVQKGLDFSGAPSLVSGDNLRDFGTQVSGSIYDQAKRNLDPRFQQEETKVGNDLVNRGIAVGSPAFTTAMSNYRQSRDNAYADAQDRATQGGVSAANTLFGQGLAARQQSIGETTSAGQFKNAAQQLAESEAATRAGFQNTAQAQQYGENQTDWAQQLALAQQNAGLQNAAHGTAYNEQIQQREMPLQEIAGLLGTGPGVQSLTPQGTPNVATNPANIADLVGGNYSSLLGSYNQRAGQAASQNASTAQAIGTIAAIAAASDRRVKKHIKRIGTADNGLPLYSFQYISGGPTIVGVMAQDVQEVNPGAVHDIDGVLHVDYNAAFADTPATVA